MNNSRVRHPFYQTSILGQCFFIIIIMIFCFAGLIDGQTQSPTEAEQKTGAIDPLLENFKSPRPGVKNSFLNLPLENISRNHSGLSAPTAGELDSSLNVSIDSSPGNVRATVVQSDGKILVAGYFRTVNGMRQKGIVRLNADYTLDASFSADVNGTILAVAVQTDGKIIIGGAFTTVGGRNRNRIARLNADGSLDAAFNPGNGADAPVFDVAVQPDGKILVGGNFFQINSVFNYAVARLNADGSVDTSFKSPIPSPTSTPEPPFQLPAIVYSIDLQTNGKIIIAGLIVEKYEPVLVTTPVARLNSDGNFDSSFAIINANSNASKVAVQPDGKILLAGYFSTINGVAENYIARLNADGSLDQSFKIGAGANRPILALNLQSDGKILIGGIFSSFNEVSRNQTARLNVDGSLDTSFNNSGFLLGNVYDIAPITNEKVIVVGEFFGGVNFGGSDSIRVFNADGSNDSSVRFNTTVLGGVRAIAVQPDGKILVGGNFDRPGSGTLNQIFRLNADGSIDTGFGASSTTFSSSSNGQVNSIIVQPDGKIIVAGYTLIVRTGNSLGLITGIARLNADGTADNTFTPGGIPAARGFNAAALQPDGKIIVVYGSSQSNGLQSGGIARLNSDGSLDNTFNSSLPAAFFDSVVIQPDGKILIGGPFNFSFVSSQTASINYNGVVRVNADGSRDTTFVPATTSDFTTGRVTEISALALGTNGKILIGGRIYADGNAEPAGTARLNSNGTLDTTFNLLPISSVADIARVEDILPTADGKILIGGLFDRIGNEASKNISRLNADGTVDNSFVTTTDNEVYEVTIQTDGKILIGGDFETVNGVAQTSLARLLNSSSSGRTKFDFDGDGKADISVFRPSNGVWYLQQSTGGFSGTQFGVSTDKLVPADYDGDGKTDIAVYRNGIWYLSRSSAGFTSIAFGEASDVPQPTDFDGDGKAELVVWRPSNGVWYVLNLATNSFTSAQFGTSTDKPVASDYDGDGKADYAVFRPSNGVWYLNRSTLGFTSIQFGDSQDEPVPTDYDGDRKTDIAVFRPSNGVWYLKRSTAGFTGIQFGISTDMPVPADYDGDGKTDVAVYRGGTWYLNRSTAGFTGIAFGASTDKPIENAFVP